ARDAGVEEVAVGPKAGAGGAATTVLRASLELPAGTRLMRPDGSTLASPVAISPAGDCVVFAAVREGSSRLYRRDLDAFDAEEIPGTEGGSSPIFSADGEWIAFHAAGWLRKLRLSDGRSIQVRVLPHFNGVGLDWRQGEEFVLTPSLLGSGLTRVTEDGRPLGDLTSLQPEVGEYHHAWPRYVADSPYVLFSVWGGKNTGTWVVSMESGERRMVLWGALGARLLGDLLIYRSFNGPELLAVPFDVDKLETTGEPRPVADDIYETVRSGGSGSFAVSRSGSLAYEPADTGRRSLVWLDREGRAMERLGERGPYECPSLSPDGRRLAVELNSHDRFGKRWSSGSGGDIWIHDLERGTRDRLTHGSDNIRPTWTPDGRRIAFSSNRSGPWNLYWKEVDREDEATLLAETAVSVFPWSWSPDGEVLAFQEASGAGYKVGFVSREGELLAGLGSRAAEKAPVFSPDGRFLAYTSDASGADEIMVQPYPPTGQRWMVSNGGGNHARWTGNGDEIF
ncbi:MAG: hypothetical protein R3190_19725, partial [Thermoanaerobaculia bacterium]|nr:hypothetical protein [Thermoanaerobaculia bacterium]